MLHRFVIEIARESFRIQLLTKEEEVEDEEGKGGRD